MFKILIPAAIASLIALSPAQAFPVSAAGDGARTTNASALTLIADRNDRNGMRRDRDDNRRFTPGRRYNNAPSGWNRHGNRRPSDWRSRRCIMVGPIWFCP